MMKLVDRRTCKPSRHPIILRVLLLLSLAAPLCGCESIPRNSPGSPTAHGSEILRYADVIPLTVDNISTYRGEPVSIQPTRARLEKAAPEDLISPGDFINVRIFESRDQALFGSAVTGGTQFGPLYVSPLGFVDIPFVGKIKAADKSLAEFASQIKEKAAPISFRPEVIVTFVSNQASTITISGGVKAPGRYSLLDGVRTALDAVDRAGGPAGQPYQVDVVLRRNSEVRRIPLWDIINGADFPLQRGDDLVLVDAPRLVTGLGAIAKSGNYPLPRPDTNLIEMLGDVGGLIDQQSDRTGVVIFRSNTAAFPTSQSEASGPAHNAQIAGAEVARPVFFTLDLSQPVSMVVAQQFHVQAGDVLYVTDAPVSDIMKYLAPILRAVSIGRSISSSAGVVIGSGN
jgi:polysaccharide export outer membrane protein